MTDYDVPTDEPKAAPKAVPKATVPQLTVLWWMFSAGVFWHVWGAAGFWWGVWYSFGWPAWFGWRVSDWLWRH